MEHYHVESVRDGAKSYAEFVRSRDLSAGVYRLAAGADDPQKPHTEDEIYYVISGRSRFRGGDRDVGVVPGDVLFVPAGEEHRFYSIVEDLELLVVFGPAEGSGKSK